MRADPEWAAHLRSLNADDPLPDWVLKLGRRPGGRRSGLGRVRRLRWWLLPVALAAAVLLAVALREPYVGIKGEAVIVVHRQVPRGSEVWDGRGALHAGDHLQLEVRGVPTRWFAVVHLDPDEPPAVLATGSTPGLLEPAWVFDEDARGSRIVLVGADREPDSVAAESLLALPALAEIRLR